MNDDELCGWTGFNHDEDLLPACSRAQEPDMQKTNITPPTRQRQDHHPPQLSQPVQEDRHRQRMLRLSLPRHWKLSNSTRTSKLSGNTTARSIGNNESKSDHGPHSTLLTGQSVVGLKSARVTIGEMSCLTVISKSTSDNNQDHKCIPRASPILGQLVSLKARRVPILESMIVENPSTFPTKGLCSSTSRSREPTSPLLGKYLIPVASAPSLAPSLTCTCNLTSSTNSATVIGQHGVRHAHKLCRNDRTARLASLQDVATCAAIIANRDLHW